MIKRLKRAVHRNSTYLQFYFLSQRIKKYLNPHNNFHIDKIEKILAARTLYNIDLFVETGTYLGVTTAYVQKFFKRVYSIELSETLAQEAMHHFKNKPHVTILQGDSGLLLGKIVAENPVKKIFWLDAHYSAGITASSATFGDTPISKEIEEILNHWVDKSVILVDDAGLFVGKDNYPTLESLIAFVASKDLGLKVFVDKEIIHIL